MRPWPQQIPSKFQTTKSFSNDCHASRSCAVFFQNEKTSLDEEDPVSWRKKVLSPSIQRTFGRPLWREPRGVQSSTRRVHLPSSRRRTWPAHRQVLRCCSCVHSGIPILAMAANASCVVLLIQSTQGSILSQLPSSSNSSRIMSTE